VCIAMLIKQKRQDKTRQTKRKKQSERGGGGI
jgi:hypothetical protein